MQCSVELFGVQVLEKIGHVAERLLRVAKQLGEKVRTHVLAGQRYLQSEVVLCQQAINDRLFESGFERHFRVHHTASQITDPLELTLTQQRHALGNGGIGVRITEKQFKVESLVLPSQPLQCLHIRLKLLSGDLLDLPWVRRRLQIVFDEFANNRWADVVQQVLLEVGRQICDGAFLQLGLDL